MNVSKKDINILTYAKAEEDKLSRLLIVVALLLKLKGKYRLDEESVNDEMENSEINEMLSYRYRSRVIVTTECINEKSVSALRYAKSLSNDIIAFSVCSDAKSAEKLKKDFSLLDTDIALVTKYSEQLNATEQLLEFMESTEYNCMSDDVITVILPRFTTRNRWWNLSQNHSQSYIESELKRYENVIVMTLP